MEGFFSKQIVKLCKSLHFNMWMTRQMYSTVLTPKNCSNAIMQIKNIAKKLCEKQDLNILYVTPGSF